ncbi:PREDICTED: WEB family protein At1g75720 isoform X1 [Prunus mume]|uniref:WEB family protein At1g75720 isoform X1 n=1 Tax=Prunus mume TaxID=102107 RepID=A0ABM0N921_PRUMU|nr:PREDICTED: WEB family protein At1g75720 isoform X1 [Prunus mume]
MENNNETAAAAGGVQVQGVRRMKRAEIDTRQPFRSVKEAVSLFGEKFLAGELYATQLKQMQNGAHENGHRHGPASRIGSVTAELEETKQSLQKAREESELMENCLSSLKQELERTKRELHQLKEREYEKQFVEAEIIEDVRNIVEDSDSTKFEMKTQTSDEEERSFEFQNKRYVTFANPPSLAQVKIAQGLGVDEKLQRHPSLSLKKKKNKPFIPLIAGMFSKKKGGPQVAYP